MSLDTAIKNVGDYYAAHYLADKKGFSKDIAEKVKGWKEQGSQSVPRKLAALGETYFKAKTEALNYDDPLLRVRADNDAINRWHPALLDALGYRSEPFDLVLESAQKQIPVLHRLNRHNQPWLVIAEAPFCLTGGESDEEPLEQAVIAQTQHVDGLPTLSESWEKAVALLFKQEDAPRWVMFLAGGRIYLFDAHTFAQGRYLWIDLDEAYGRRSSATFEAIAALLSDEALVPQGESDEVLHERLREGSLKSTHGVSEKLQGAVRDAIEAIANGWVEARRQNNLGYRQLSEREEPLADGSREITAEQLRHDALIYVYRLLFCFYAEARGGELGILPINDDVYRLGYSLESLRDLVDANEPGTTTENGTYIAEHLERLFQLIYDGFDPERESTADEETKSPFGQGPRQESLFGAPAGEQLSLKGTGIGRSKYTPGKVFAIQPLTATLFDPQATPLLSRVKLPNRILHKVVRCLSLGTSQQSKRVGRINYAELGIVQLGSVYEGLLSYKGFFAAEDLIQVHQKAKNGKPMLDNAVDSKVPTWFVPAHRENEFKAGEIVLEHRTERTRIYRTGEFILHLNGVDRVNSASYYTPEVLTRTLVEEALKERLKDFGPEQADDILDLKICEPAMGSAAFLVEAIDQLAHHYLELKQKQLGENIDPSNYEDELRRVRHYIAVHNVYGVDLNAVAVELGALSLWLSTIHRLKVSEGDEDNQPLFQPAATPWFGLRLRAGNSLIGARRSVWKKDQLLRGKHYGKNAEIPRQLKPGEDRQPGEIYHFLVWDEDMAPAASDKLMKEHWPDECDAINTWRKTQLKTKCSVEEVARLERLSERIDELWKDYSISRQRALADSACTSSVWPKAQNSLEALRNGPTLRRQEGLKASLEAESGAFQRLKLLMDSWCSLYFWPLDQSGNLPSREAWLAAAEVLLGIGTDDLATRSMLDIQLGEGIELEELFQASEHKLPDAERLSELVPWFGVGRDSSVEHNFHHWELIFSEVLGPKIQEVDSPSGFDIVMGNPPWIPVEFIYQTIAYELDPSKAVKRLNSPEAKKVLKSTSGAEKPYVRSLSVATAGSIAFLGGRSNYSLLKGVKVNLYRNFVLKSLDLISDIGVSGLLHPEGIYTEENSANLRGVLYKRLVAKYQFNNDWAGGFFPDADAKEKFGINIYRRAGDIGFDLISNLVDVKTIRSSYTSKVPAYESIKDDDNKYIISGSRDRITKIDIDALSAFRDVQGLECFPVEAKLLYPHTKNATSALKKISEHAKRRIAMTAAIAINETTGKDDGLITRASGPGFSRIGLANYVVTSPQIDTGTPFSKGVVAATSTEVSYEENFEKEAMPPALYSRESVVFSSDCYQLLVRNWVKVTNERTLIPAIFPAKVGFINTVVGAIFQNSDDLLEYSGYTCSIVFDFIFKVSNRDHVYLSSLQRLRLGDKRLSPYIKARSLRLACRSSLYDDLVEKVGKDLDEYMEWSSPDPRLESVSFNQSGWERYQLTSDLSVRQAQVELDVLCAMALGMTDKELISIYLLQFGTLRRKEKKDLFDAKGKILPSTARRHPAGKDAQQVLTGLDQDRPVELSWMIKGGTRICERKYIPPFSQVDRVEEYRTAYRVFSERLGLTENNKEPA